MNEVTAVESNVDLDLDWIATNSNVPSWYYKYGAYVYENVNGQAIRRQHREDSVPFRDSEQTSLHVFLGPAHAVMGSGVWRLAITGTRDGLFIMEDTEEGKLSVIHIGIPNYTGGNNSVLVIGDMSISFAFTEGKLDIVISSNTSGDWLWRATVGEEYGAGYNEFDEDLGV